ncbi:putative scaffolding protein [Pseudomonas phage MR6]|uniref:Putative scaffolding protein n=1 Tax=Pseudomonas phage MR5 TaxID=2711172 RepID=A0A6M3TCR1_9CAUD|nr:putative scaffolding protein [Pseudomonas phage MR5]QJD54868.1 putative scaffolding protein [Pseudomonas phage MR6]QJD54928.1 putative scaffolding protein [Pseudomonas phage MR7]
MAGELAKDPNLAPAVSYLDAFCVENKVDMQRAFGAASEEGDSRFIDRAYLKDVLGDKADAIIKTAEGVLNYATAYAEQTVSAVHTLAGGEANWTAAGDAFNKHAPAAERALIVEMLESGLRDKVTYAAKRIMEYATQAGAVMQHNAPAIGNPGTQKGLSNADYIKAISERNISDEKYNALKQQRMLGRSQGL